MNITIILLLLTSTIITFIATKIVKKYAHQYNLLDQPNQRKNHTIPTPRLGGIAIFIGIFLPLTFIQTEVPHFYPIFLGSLMILVIGIIDDVFNIPASLKLCFQILSCTFLINDGIAIEFISNPFGGYFYMNYLSIPMTIIWIVAIMNTINLIDGSDGISAGIGAISSFFLP